MTEIKSESISAQPFILSRLDWLRHVLSWLVWTHIQLVSKNVTTSDEGCSPEQVEAIRMRASEDVMELIRLGKGYEIASPLVFLRQVVAPTADDIPMPPLTPGEKGN